MIELPVGTHIWLVAGITNMRQGFDGLTAIIQERLAGDPFSATSLSFVANGATSSNCCGPTSYMPPRGSQGDELVCFLMYTITLVICATSCNIHVSFSPTKI